MAVGCVAAWWLMGVPGLVGWVAGAWGGMSAATPWELDDEDGGETPGSDGWEPPRAAVHSHHEERFLCVDTHVPSAFLLGLLRPPLRPIFLHSPAGRLPPAG